MKITANKYVAVTYDLHVGDGDERKLEEKVTADRPLEFIFGTGLMIPAFETALDGLEIGSTFDFSLTPENAHGEYSEDNVCELPKNIFEVDGKFDAERVQKGNSLPMMDSDGNLRWGLVKEVKPDVVVMDFNHPLAGKTLHFKGAVLEVHEATVEEIAQLCQPAGGCGGGCGSCGGCGDSCGDSCGGCH